MEDSVVRPLVKKASIGLLATGMAIASAIGFHLAPLRAQTTPGLTIFGGPENALDYTIDFNKPYSTNARYYLEVDGDRLVRDVISMEIAYPAEFVERLGRFDVDAIELREGDYRGRGEIPVADIIWDQENHVLEIYPEEPIPAGQNFVIVLSDVRNPRRFAIHYFNLSLMFQGGVIDQYVGTWPLEVAAE
ncbi:hypothetical protein C7271_17665 [filamentous cyanobacterium CCP5]|nr:hypothetical protein C7271_17665 [filamentous cyanobacterium CCP5]